MTTNANGDGPVSAESFSDKPAQPVNDEDWEGLKRSRKQTAKPDGGGKFSLSDGIGIIVFIVCWIVFGVIIFQTLIGMGIFLVFAVLGGIIGGFLAAVLALLVAMSGFSL